MVEEEEEWKRPDEEEPGGGAMLAPLLGRHIAVVKTSLVVSPANHRTPTSF